MKIFKRYNGITLISLVVTIIILLILAGISLNLLIGDNGILKKAALAKEKTEIAQLEENIKLATLGEFEGSHLSVAKVKVGIKNDLPDAKVIGNEFPLIIIVKGKTYQLDEDGELIAVEMEENELNELTAGNGVYAKLYNINSKKVLVIDNNPDFTYNSGTLDKAYSNENQEFLRANGKTVWYDDAAQIDKVIINGAVFPDSTQTWFKDCTKCYIYDIYV